MRPRFQYVPGASFFHRMDPTWKFAWNLVVLAAVLAHFEVGYGLAWFAYAAALALGVARLPLRTFVRGLSFFLGIGLLVLLWHSLYSRGGGPALAAWGPFTITRAGLLSGLAVFFRILALACLTLIFTLTTDPARLVESVIQVARVPYRMGFTLYAALRFIPVLENEAQVLANAHRVRGVGAGYRAGYRAGRRQWGPVGRWAAQLRLSASLIVPLLVSGLRRAQVMALAMDSRAFGAYTERTVLHPAQVTWGARLFVLAHAAVTAAALYYYVLAGHGAPFVPSG